MGDWESESKVQGQCGEKEWKVVGSHVPEKVREDCAKDTGVVFEEVNGDKREWRGEVVNAGEERGKVMDKRERERNAGVRGSQPNTHKCQGWVDGVLIHL